MPVLEVPRTPDGERGVPFTLTVVVDPTCPASAASVQDAAAFARAHPEVAVRVLLATRPGGSNEAGRALLAWAEAGIPVTWAPAAVRRLAPTAVPAVYLQNARGRRVQATGRPPLETLWRAVHGGSP